MAENDQVQAPKRMAAIKLARPQFMGEADHGVRIELVELVGPFIPREKERIYNPGCDFMGIYQIVDFQRTVLHKDINSIVEARRLWKIEVDKAEKEVDTVRTIE